MFGKGRRRGNMSGGGAAWRYCVRLLPDPTLSPLDLPLARTIERPLFLPRRRPKRGLRLISERYAKHILRRAARSRDPFM
jgi:hypothetical protein